MDKRRNSEKDPTKAVHALSKYLELFSADCDFFKFYIAQNGVLEWYGRTVKGNNKIHDFLRFEVCPQYDHLFFETAQICEPFECKSSHMETKRFPTEQDMTANINSTDVSFAGDKTVLDKQISTAFDASAKKIEDSCGSITPPSTAKRFKLDEDHNLSRSFPPLLNIDDYFDRSDTNVIQIPRVIRPCFETPDASTTIETIKSCSADYSELRYLETIGILRSCTQPEYRNFRNSSTLNVNGTWDRKTKIKISYRIRLQDDDIQFALITYQNVHPYSVQSKRNLMSEFDEVGSQKRVAANTGSIARPIPTTPQLKRKIGRRLLL